MIFKEIMQYMLYKTMPKYKNHGLPPPPHGVSEKSDAFLCNTYSATPQHKIPSPGVMKFTILVYPSLCIIIINSVCLVNSPGVGKKILKEIHRFYTFYPKSISLKGGGHKTQKFLYPYPTDSTHQIWSRTAKQYLRKK